MTNGYVSLTRGWYWCGPVGKVGGGPEPAALRSTASQMQRGSGELQSTPTGFWKLQSDPAGAGQGSMAAGMGAWSLLTSTSLGARMGQSTRTHTRGSVGHFQVRENETKTQKE